jgi:uncharacterized protein DUF1565/Big-like domain-containing protein
MIGDRGSQWRVGRVVAATICLTTIVTGCSNSTEAPSVASVLVTLATATLFPGQTTQASAVARDSKGATLTDHTASSFSSSNTAVATVTSSGLVTAVAAGSATISAVIDGVTGTSPALTVSPVPVANVVVTPAAATQLAIGGTVQFTATPRDAANNPLTGRTITWTTSNAGVASVSGSGQVAGVASGGPVTITATSEGQSGTAQVTVCLANFAAPAGVTASTFVSSTLGSDATTTGSCAAPHKTITHAVAAARTGDVIWVAPGTYNAALGEVFPISLPASVTLIGDEANKGQGPTATRVIGGANLAINASCGTYQATIYPGANDIIAGLELTDPSTTFAAMTLLIRNNNVTIRNNSIVNNTGGASAVYICNSSVNHIITGNRIRDNGGQTTGLAFINGGVGSKVENNLITRNGNGVEYDSPGGDMGGGSAGSTGGNSIFCNTFNDLWTNTTITINAANNFWDHVPLSGNDVYNGSGATIVSTGGTVAPGSCP